MPAESASSRRAGRSRLKAPVEDGGLLARPPLDQLGRALRANELVFRAAERLNLQGHSLAVLRAMARESTLRLARDYTLAVTGEDSGTATGGGPWIMTGHQPGLFHPGVWVKNFVVDAAARQRGGCGVNLIVDNDLLTTTGVAVPRGPREKPFVEHCPLLPPQHPRPWEEVAVPADEVFRSFGTRISETVERDWGYRPVLADCWGAAVSLRESSGRVADVLAGLRARQERRWGGRNLELPLSRLEESDPFRWFACHLLVDAGRFRDIHNAELAIYRRENRIRSHSHPVPELRRRDGWIEAPFWVWRAGETQRRPLFIRPGRRALELAADQEFLGRLRLHPEGDAGPAVEELRELAREGWKLRTRALTTTLFTRLCLADLFVHGIGGAKYDEITDRIIERFYGLTPPVFMTLTATLRLPLQPFPIGPLDLQQARRNLRDLVFNPDRYLSTASNESLGAAKQSLLSELQDHVRFSNDPARQELRRAALRRVHRELETVRTKAQALVGAERDRWVTAVETLSRQLAANRILQSREYSWCLFPESMLRGLFERVHVPSI